MLRCANSGMNTGEGFPGTSSNPVVRLDLHPYPFGASRLLGQTFPSFAYSLGNAAILNSDLLAIFCSVRCPGKVILDTYQLAQHLRETKAAVTGGFHSPLEREILINLWRGANSIVICPARGITGMRLPSEYRRPLAEGRLLILSPFDEKQRRQTADMAMYRNRFVASLADRVFVAYAAPGSRTEQFCAEVLEWGKPLLTLEGEANRNLIEMGAEPVSPTDIRNLVEPHGGG